MAEVSWIRTTRLKQNMFHLSNQFFIERQRDVWGYALPPSPYSTFEVLPFLLLLLLLVLLIPLQDLSWTGEEKIIIL